LIAVVVVLVLGAAGAISFAVIRQRDERRREIEHQEEARARLRPLAATAKVSPAPADPHKAEAAPVIEPSEPEEVEVFKTQREFADAFRKAASIKDEAGRWKAFRRMGFLRTPEQFRKVEADLRVRVGTSEFEQAFIGGIFKDWVQSDFKGFLAFMMRVPTEPSVTTQEKLKQMLLGAARWNRDAVVAYAQALTEEEGRSEILKTLSVLDPPKPEAVQAMAVGPERVEATKRLLREWARRDPRAAAQWVEQLPDADERGEARSELAAGWGSADHRAAAAWVDQLASAKERQGLLRDVIRGATERDPREAFELAVNSLEAKDLWCLEAEKALRRWGQTDPAAAARFLQTLPVGETKDLATRQSRTMMTADLGKLWAVRDPSAALEWAERLEGDERTTTLIAMSGALVKSIISNPIEALSVIDKLPASRRQEALCGVVEAWADIDPRAAAEFARSRPESTPALDEVIARRWANRDLAASVAWTKTLPEGVDRDSALQAVAIASAQRDPLRGSELAREIRDAVLRDQALEYVTQQLSGKDLQMAIAMTAEIADSTRRKSAQGSILGNCASKDPEACLALLNGMADATHVEYGAFAQAWAQKDARAAVAWASGLSRTDLREWSLIYAFPQWAFTEPDAARTWVDRANLSDAFRKKLLKLMPAGRQ
jgi:hypothetical protein